jgi:hypothetical protein
LGDVDKDQLKAGILPTRLADHPEEWRETLLAYYKWYADYKIALKEWESANPEEAAALAEKRKANLEKRNSAKAAKRERSEEEAVRRGRSDDEGSPVSSQPRRVRLRLAVVDMESNSILYALPLEMHN